MVMCWMKKEYSLQRLQMAYLPLMIKLNNYNMNQDETCTYCWNSIYDPRCECETTENTQEHRNQDNFLKAN